MPRHARVTSELMHLIIRGNGKQIIFEDNSDRYTFLERLQRFSEKWEVKTLAYCLMDNHVHFLVEDPKRHVSDFMKGLEISYTSYFNKKYDRTGHLFQDRFKNENITDYNHLLHAYRYILQNPEKAGICSAVKYKWSSLNEAFYGRSIADPSKIISLFGSEAERDSFLKEKENQEFMEDVTVRHDDKWAIRTMQAILSIKSGNDLRKLCKEDRNAAIIKLHEAHISSRQLERLTGISRTAIQNIIFRAKLCEHRITA